MRAVNLIPSESRPGRVTPSLGRLGTSHALVGLLTVVLGFVTLYVLTSNTISNRKAQLASLQQQTSQLQADVARFSSYQKFETLAQQRAATVRQIASTRFNWNAALSDLSRVVPANTSLQSLTGTAKAGSSTGAASAGATTAGSAGAATAGSPGATTGPTVALKGCTANQDDVARLMSRLRLINGVSQVTLQNSTENGSGGSGGSGASGTSSGGSCAANGPSFDMVVAFQPAAGATK